jgi:hypothetical protein
VLSGTLDVWVLPQLQTTYRWDGTQYTVTGQVEVKPGYPFDMNPVTETLDLDGDGQVERVTSRWVPDCGGLWQILSIQEYDEDGDWQSARTFTASSTIVPTTGISLRDTDGDGRSEVVLCETTFTLTAFGLDLPRWPSMLPQCTTYDWVPVDGRK